MVHRDYHTVDLLGELSRRESRAFPSLVVASMDIKEDGQAGLVRVRAGDVQGDRPLLTAQQGGCGLHCAVARLVFAGLYACGLTGDHALSGVQSALPGLQRLGRFPPQFVHRRLGIGDTEPVQRTILRKSFQSAIACVLHRSPLIGIAGRLRLLRD